MSRSVPWDSIPTPAADFTVVRVAEAGRIPIYWGRDTGAQCLLIVELQGDHAAQFRRDMVTLHGIGVDLRNGDKGGGQRLVLTLARHIDSDLFLGLCETLIGSLKNVADSAAALSVALAHLKRWKTFLAGRNARLLSPEEVRGLFGELHVLRRLYQDTLTQAGAVEAWCGPDDSHQDFIFGDRAIEVKSLSGRERSAVRISSEDQLESLADELFLLTLRLIERPDAEKALSLNGAVTLITGELTDSEAVEQFMSKLADVGYAPLVEYDSPCFVVRDIQGYHVHGGFPRLIRSELPAGIVKVAYDIRLETIAQHQCDDAVIFGG
ncbi:MULTISPECIES: PD-(D/E)XK motif protein [Pectobacterium]|uniref:PD-(D/E)XK motif protein n=1 Tax=Pectobacterium polonicum TaxID=2485124 RepID=A0AAE9NNM1_9GAMM|nr:PD-(D/E)XK motif protein [Pectobacterium polonicum]UVO06926.1 PD-(D/E)XK motif protein [Pectobacterium polonicum]